MNLIEHFIKVSTDSGEPLQLVVDEMNKELGAKYTVSRIGEWRDGRRSLPDIVQRYMLQIALPRILRCHGLDIISVEDEFIDPLVDALMPHNVKISGCRKNNY